jgi:hypothetical protein
VFELCGYAVRFHNPFISNSWLRAYDAASGHEIWRFDGNSKDARWRPRPGNLSRSFVLASPVFAEGRVFIAMGGVLGTATDLHLFMRSVPTAREDVSESRLLWTSGEVGRVAGTPIENRSA